VQQRRRDADSRLSPLQRPNVSGQFQNLWLAQLLPNDGSSPLIPAVNTSRMRASLLVKVMQIGPFVPARIIAMTVRAIHHEQMPALRCVDCQFRASLG
jgi:hypothetical protein